MTQYRIIYVTEGRLWKGYWHAIDEFFALEYLMGAFNQGWVYNVETK